MYSIFIESHGTANVEEISVHETVASPPLQRVWSSSRRICFSNYDCPRSMDCDIISAI
jgi:hypothetical protein